MGITRFPGDAIDDHLGKTTILDGDGVECDDRNPEDGMKPSIIGWGLSVLTQATGETEIAIASTVKCETNCEAKGVNLADWQPSTLH